MRSSGNIFRIANERCGALVKKGNTGDFETEMCVYWLKNSACVNTFLFFCVSVNKNYP